MNYESENKMNLLVICGPTAVGKSKLAVEIAKKHDGEVLSADSRQVYNGLDIATGKISKEDMDGIPHHLLDVADPQEDFSVADFKQLADKKVEEIHNKERLPILCGGTGFYIQAIVDDFILPDVKPNQRLRNKLQEKSTEELFKQLQNKDPRRAKDIDKNNPRRLIRALEIVDELGKVPKLKKKERFDILQIGLDLPDKELKQRIITRTKERFDNGIVEEVKRLHKSGLSLYRMRELGLEYEHLANYLEGKISKEKLFENIIQSDWQYARRQRTWFKKDERVEWFNPDERGKIKERIVAFLG